MKELKRFSNDEVDEAFQKLNAAYYATENRVIRQLQYFNMQLLANEIVRRDRSMLNKFQQFFVGLLADLKLMNKKETNKGLI